MKLIEDLYRKRKIYKILSLAFLIVDMLCYCTMESLDMTFTLDSEHYSQKLVIFILKLIATIIFVAFLLSLIYLQFINTLLICAIAYLVIGVILFCYMLMEELQNVHMPIDPRPTTYFQYHIEDIIIILNIACGISRITGSIMIIFLITIIRIIIKRTELENENTLINGDHNNALIVNPNEENNHNPHRTRNTMGSQSFTSEEKDEFDMSYNLPKKEKIVKKTGSFSESYDSIGKRFETPVTTNFIRSKDS